MYVETRAFYVIQMVKESYFSSTGRVHVSAEVKV